MVIYQKKREAEASRLELKFVSIVPVPDYGMVA